MASVSYKEVQEISPNSRYVIDELDQPASATAQNSIPKRKIRRLAPIRKRVSRE